MKEKILNLNKFSKYSILGLNKHCWIQRSWKLENWKPKIFLDIKQFQYYHNLRYDFFYLLCALLIQNIQLSTIYNNVVHCAKTLLFFLWPIYLSWISSRFEFLVFIILISIASHRFGISWFRNFWLRSTTLQFFYLSFPFFRFCRMEYETTFYGEHECSLNQLITYIRIVRTIFWLFCGTKIENVMIALNEMEMEVLLECWNIHSFIFMMLCIDFISFYSAIPGPSANSNINHPIVAFSFLNGIITIFWEVPQQKFLLHLSFK